MNEVEQAVRWSSHPHPHPPGSTDHPQKVTWANCHIWSSLRGPSAKDHHQRSTSSLCSSHRGAQMLSPRCDSRRSAVSKIHQGTVCVQVTYQQSHIFTYQTLPRACSPIFCRSVGKEWVQQYSTPVFSTCDLQTSFPWGGTGADRLFLRGHKNN